MGTHFIQMLVFTLILYTSCNFALTVAQNDKRLIQAKNRKHVLESRRHWLKAAKGSAKEAQTAKASVRSTKTVSEKGQHCTYNLIINEIDGEGCPVAAQYEQKEQPTGKVNARKSGVGFGQTTVMGKMTDKVRDLESQLYKEMINNRVLNGTVGRHEFLLRKAETMLWDQQKNLTKLHEYVKTLEKTLAKTDEIVKSVENKISGVMLNVGELITTVENKIPETTNILGKTIPVQAVGNIKDCHAVSGNSTKYKDCDELYSRGHKVSGIYYIKPLYSPCPIPVWCDMDTVGGGWLVLSRRQPPGDEEFDRDWGNYSKGFGNLTGEFWLGNENMFLISNQAKYKIRVDLWDFYHSRVYAEYDMFYLSGEREHYQLHIGNHSGTVRDGLGRHDGQYFSTPDRDNDSWLGYHCAIDWKCGWWFNNCWFVILNGPYLNQAIVKYKGIAWNDWKAEQLKKAEMKIKPADPD